MAPQLTTTYRRLQAARTSLLLGQPFFGVLALQLRLKEDPDAGTAWTDGHTIAFDPEFTEKCTQDELTAVFAHEVLHCACGHPWRRDARTHERWNHACDYAINAILRDAGFKLPTSALLDPQYDGKFAEWIYDRLPESQPNGKPNGSGGSPSNDPLGELRSAPSDADGPNETDWKQTAEQSLAQAKARGTVPGSLVRAIGELLQSIVDWRSVLRRYVQETARNDYSWTSPNRRYIASGLYLPELRVPACGRIAIAIDTSGSIDRVLLNQFASEMQSIADEMKPEAIDVIYCDSRVQRIDRFERDEPIEVHPAGGGGTAFGPVFDQLESDPPIVLVYLTDLDGSMPDHAPEFPVIWASTSGDRSVPFGDVVPLS